MAKQLYDYQEVAKRVVLDHLKKSSKALVVKASGLGKTILSAALVKDFISRGLHGLFICDSNEALEQARDAYKEQLDKGTILCLFTGLTKDWDADKADVVFSSFQLLGRYEYRKAFFTYEFDFIIVDEAHHATAPTYKSVLDYFTPKYLIAFTATPDRMEGEDIRNIFGEEVISIGIPEAIANKWLTPIDYRMMNDTLHSSQLKKLMQEILDGRKVSVKQLNETIFIEERDKVIAEKIISWNLKTIIFCESILHADNFSQFLPGSKVFHSNQPARQQREVLDAFRNDELRYILAVDKFNEAIDVPNTKMVVFLRSTDSKTVFLQQLGRGLRLHPNKDKVVVLDFVANADRVQMVHDLAMTIKSRQCAVDYDETPTYVSGKGFRFEFSQELVDVISIVRLINSKLYISDIPDLLAEYHPTKNELPASQVLAGTSKKLWWKCSDPTCGHEWQAKGSNRSWGTGCPACLNKVVTSNNNLTVTHPKLAKEYHPTKNELPASRIFAGTKKKLWWKCSKCGHEWQTRCRHRADGTGCPACANRVATPENNLTVTHPELAKEYHPTKNVLPADKVVASTNKKLWWKCSKCGHEWQTKGSYRVQGSGCPVCARRKGESKDRAM